jgi:RNA polymerase sigma factor (sigma-70 family)
MVQLRGNNKGCVVVTGDGEEYKFRSGEHEGLRELVKHMNKNLFEEQTHLLEKEHKEAIEWLHEFQEELPRMKGVGAADDGAAYYSVPPFVVGRKYDDWALEILDECESSIAYIEETLADPEVSEGRKRILRAMRSDLIYTRDIIREGTEVPQQPMTRKSKLQREISVDPFEMMDIPQEEEEGPDTELLQGLIEELFDMAGLSPREREIFHMKYGEMMSEREIAEILGVNIKTVSSLLVRSRKKFKKVAQKQPFVR